MKGGEGSLLHLKHCHVDVIRRIHQRQEKREAVALVNEEAEILLHLPISITVVAALILH